MVSRYKTIISLEFFFRRLSRFLVIVIVNIRHLVYITENQTYGILSYFKTLDFFVLFTLNVGDFWSHYTTRKLGIANRFSEGNNLSQPAFLARKFHPQVSKDYCETCANTLKCSIRVPKEPYSVRMQISPRIVNLSQISLSMRNLSKYSESLPNLSKYAKSLQE